MADNVNVTPGSGAVIGTRDSGAGIEIQRVIPNTWNGTTATDISTANPMPTQQTGAIPTGTNNLGSITLKDGASSNLASIAVLHSSDNQATAGLSFGLLTGGVAQLINATGSLDRQRETGADNVPALGIASGSQQLASALSTTSVTTITASGSPQAVTPAAMSGTTRGAAWSIQVGSVLTVGSAAQQENIVVTAVTGTTFSAVFTKNKSGTWPVSGFTYNQARDATLADGTSGAGLSAGGTYLLNPNLNSSVGGWEAAKSTLGTGDGATGAGLGAASEYGYNGLGNDRLRTVQGKVQNSLTISSGGGVGSTSITFTTTPTGLQPGAPLTLTGGTSERVYASASYVAGSSPVTLASAIVNASHTGATYESFAISGPGLNGFSGIGVPVTQSVLYDPVSSSFYIERSATGDGLAGANIVMESNGRWNGATFDREYGNTGGTALSLLGRTTTTTSTTLTNFNGRGAIFYLFISAASGTGGLTVNIQAIDPASAQAVSLAVATTAVNAAGTYTYSFYPGASGTASGMGIAAGQGIFAGVLPRTFQVKVVHGDATNYTYSVGYSLIV